MGVNVKFQLCKESIKPFFRLKIGTANITCLYDSGVAADYNRKFSCDLV